MLRIVLDTSTVVSFVLTTGDITNQIVLHWRQKHFTVLQSPATLRELIKVLNRPVIQQRAKVSIDRLSKEMNEFSDYVPGDLTLAGVCRDPNDEPFLACAVEGKAHYLVTSDKDLLALKQYAGVCILNPGQFLVALTLWQTSASDIKRRYSQGTLQTISRTICLEPATQQKINELLS